MLSTSGDMQKLRMINSKNNFNKESLIINIKVIRFKESLTSLSEKKHLVSKSCKNTIWKTKQIW